MFGYDVDLRHGWSPLTHVPAPGGRVPEIIGVDIVRLAVQAGAHGHPEERCELREPKVPIGTGAWWGLSMRVDPGFPAVSARCVAWQIKTTAATGGSPFLALRIADGQFSLTVEDLLESGEQSRSTIASGQALPGAGDGWVRWIFGVAATNDNGLVEVRADGVVVARARGRFGIGPGTRQYFKFGPYRDRDPRWGSAPAALEFRDICRGSSIDVVA